MEKAVEIIHQIPQLINQVLTVFNAIMQVVVSVCVGFGAIDGVATNEPITLKDADNVNMAFVALADTHIRPTGISPYRLDCGFEDMENSGIDFDALVIAGDISELGDAPSYELTWESIDKSIFDTVLLATGNHDIRLAYEAQTELIIGKTAEYLETEIERPYYSYDVEGYTIIVMGSDEWQFEKAVISDEQLKFLDSELARATKDGKPAFVVCHQPLADTHGLPEVWENGDLGEDSQAVKDVLMKYENVFFLNGHLHDGIYEKSLEIFSEENGVYSINLPAYGRENDYGEFLQSGLGVYIEVYDDEVVFTARDFCAGKALEGYTKTFELV